VILVSAEAEAAEQVLKIEKLTLSQSYGTLNVTFSQTLNVVIDGKSSVLMVGYFS
jgi:hypothetical protein